MKDEIIEELWEAKDAVARKYGYDVHAMGKALQQRQKHSEVPVVDLHDPNVLHVAEEPPEYKADKQSDNE